MAKTKDRRVIKGKATENLAGYVDDVLNGRRAGRPGAEAAAFLVLQEAVTAYILGEGALSNALRAFIDGLSNPADPLRKELGPDTWAMLWPMVNALKRSRAEALKFLQERAEAAAASESTPANNEVKHGNEESTSAAVNGAGVLRAGARSGEGGAP